MILKKKALNFLPELLFLSIVLFVYLPYYIYTPVPYLLNDIFAYLYIAKDFSEGLIPLQGYTFDLPYGFGYFMHLIFSLGGNIHTIVVVQTMINISAFLLLINELKKRGTVLSLMSSLLLSLFVVLSDNMLWNITLYTESLYISGLVFLTIIILRIIRTNRNIEIWYMSVIILLLLFIRSNALYLFFLPFLLSIYFIYLKNNKWKHVIASIIVLLIVNASVNYSVKGSFSIGEYDRLKRYISTTFYNTEKNKQSKLLKPKNYRLKQAYKVFTNLKNAEMGNFYYYRIPFAYENFNKKKLTYHIEEHTFYKTDKQTNELVSFMLSSYDFNKQAFKEIESLTNIDKRPRQFWLYSNHLIHLSRYLWRNWIFVLAFYFFYFKSIVSIFKSIKNKTKINNDWFLLFTIGSVHFVSMVLLAYMGPRDTSLSRYVIVSEFNAYICIAIGVSVFIQNKLSLDS